MYRVGDMVCYPMHGVGKIEAIEDVRVSEELRTYYRIQLLIGPITVLVPVDNADSIGIRSISAKEACRNVIEYLGSSDEIDDNVTWSRRFRDNMEKLKKGDIIQVAEVVKCLKVRERVKSLSSGERKMLLTAKQVLFSELFVATGIEEEDFERLINRTAADDS